MSKLLQIRDTSNFFCALCNDVNDAEVRHQNKHGTIQRFVLDVNLLSEVISIVPKVKNLVVRNHGIIIDLHQRVVNVTDPTSEWTLEIWHDTGRGNTGLKLTVGCDIVGFVQNAVARMINNE